MEQKNSLLSTNLLNLNGIKNFIIFNKFSPNRQFGYLEIIKYCSWLGRWVGKLRYHIKSGKHGLKIPINFRFTGDQEYTNIPTTNWKLTEFIVCEENGSNGANVCNGSQHSPCDGSWKSLHSPILLLLYCLLKVFA